MNMKDLQIQSPNLITYADDLFTVDVLGGVDLQQIEKMFCTLRVCRENFPPFRTSLDLYADSQVDKLLRSLCDKYDLPIFDVSRSVHSFIAQLEDYRLQHLRYPQSGRVQAFEMGEEEEITAKNYLQNADLIPNLQRDLQQIGILGEDDNALTLFLSMASHKAETPFSVLCLAKSGIGKSYLLQKLSNCMPRNSYTLHTQISENALYYFDSQQIDGKALFIEDFVYQHRRYFKLSHKRVFPYSKSAMFHYIEVLQEVSGLNKDFGLHTLRHSIATHLLQNGMTVEQIARFLGHSSLDSTQIYTHLAAEDDE